MPESQKSSPLLVAAAWLVVILPTVWGLSYTVKNAMKLFAAPSVTTTAPASTTH